MKFSEIIVLGKREVTTEDVEAPPSQAHEISSAEGTRRSQENQSTRLS